MLAEERGKEGEQTVDPTETVPFPDALLQVSWVVQASVEAAATQLPAGILLAWCSLATARSHVACLFHLAGPA